MSSFQTVMCAGKAFNVDYINRIRLFYSAGRTDIYVATVLVNKKNGRIFVEMRVGTPKHNVFWDMCEVEGYAKISIGSVRGIDKFGPEYECVMFRGKTSDVYLENGKKAFDVDLKL